MKNKINNAMNDISDKLIEEAAKADRLEHKTARIIRNIAVPVGAVAAAAAVCFGLNQMGVFGGRGVELVESSSAADSTTATTSDTSSDTVSEVTAEPIEFPKDIRYDNISDEYFIYFTNMNSKVLKPEIIYADEKMAVFTDNCEGLFYYSFDTKKLTQINIQEAFNDFCKGADVTPFGEIEYVADIGGGIYCVFPYVTTLTDIASEPDGKAYYFVNTETGMLTSISWDLIDIALYDGLADVQSDVHALSKKKAYIDGTDKYVFIRRSSADYDLLPTFPHEHIELMMTTDEQLISGAMEGGYLPFNNILDVPYVDIPETDNSQAALCDKILMANEPTEILKTCTGYTIKDPNNSVNRNIVEAGMATNLFQPDGMGLNGITDNAGRYQVEFVGAKDENGWYCGKYFYVNTETLLIECIEEFTVDTAGKEQEIVSQLFINYDVAADEAPAEEVCGYPTKEWFDNRELGMVWPVGGENGGRIIMLPEEYGGYYGHKGVDIAEDVPDSGTPVLAALDGTVTFAEWNGGYGLCVKIRHSNGMETLYAHLRSYSVNVGDTVTAGQQIGEVGSTGQSTGYHLHFEVTVNGENKYPLDYLPLHALSENCNKQ